MESQAILLDAEAMESMIGRVVAEAAEQIYQAQGSQGGLTVARAWVYQKSRDVQAKGEAASPYYVGYYDPDGKKQGKCCGTGAEGKRLAGKFRRQVEAELLTGTYGSNLKKMWEEFRLEYQEKVLAGKSPHTQRQARMSLENFERIIAPKKLSSITTKTIDQFTASRRLEQQRYRRSDAELTRVRTRPYAETRPVSVASVNADLRNIKTALAVAHDWGYLLEVPKFRMIQAAQRLPVYVLPEHFAALYQACDHARLPACQGYTPADWWRAVLVFVYQATGWRIGQVLSLERKDLDLEAGTAIARAASQGNKAKRDRLVKIHPAALEHVSRLPGFSSTAFPWPHNRRTLFAELQRLCGLAGIPRYGWHSLRKGFGTMNAPRLSATELQHLMQHASLQTTQRFYVNPNSEQEATVGKLYVPDVLKRAQ